MGENFLMYVLIIFFKQKEINVDYRNLRYIYLTENDGMRSIFMDFLLRQKNMKGQIIIYGQLLLKILCFQTL